MTTHYKVEMQYGYIIYGAHDEDKAWLLFRERGVRIFRLNSIHDEGVLIEGLPVVVNLDYETRKYRTN